MNDDQNDKRKPLCNGKTVLPTDSRPAEASFNSTTVAQMVCYNHFSTYFLPPLLCPGPGSDALHIENLQFRLKTKRQSAGGWREAVVVVAQSKKKNKRDFRMKSRDKMKWPLAICLSLPLSLPLVCELFGCVFGPKTQLNREWITA